MSDTDAKIRALMERVDKLEHALLVLSTWHHGQDEYVKNILGPEAVQCAEFEHGHSSDEPLFDSKVDDLLETVADQITDFVTGFANKRK